MLHNHILVKLAYAHLVSGGYLEAMEAADELLSAGETVPSDLRFISLLYKAEAALSLGDVGVAIDAVRPDVLEDMGG